MLPRGAADVVGGNEISTEGIGHGRPHRLAGLDPCGTEICDNLVDARPSYQLGSVRIWNLQWGGESRLRWGKVAPDVMVSPWCHGVGGVWGRHGEVAVVFLLQIAVGATWVAAELRGNRFSTEADLLLGAGLSPPGWLWSCEAVAQFEACSDPPKRPWGRGRAYCSGPARARRGGLWGAWSGTPFEVGLGLAEAAVDSGRGHIAQDQLGTCQDDRGGGVGERHTVRSSTSGPAQTSPLWIREWLRRSVLGRPDS